MTPAADTPPQNIPVLWTAGVLEYVFEHREGDRSAPRKLMRANQMLLQALYASDLLIGCVNGAPAGVEGVGRRYLMAASDEEAAAAYLSEARPAGSGQYEFLPVSVISPAAATPGRWKAQRDAWTAICQQSGSVALVLNPAGPHTATFAAAAFQMGKPRRLGQPAEPEAGQFQPPQIRAAGRQRARTALAAVAAGERARPHDARPETEPDAAAQNPLRDPLLRLALAQLDARAELDRGESELGLRRLMFTANELWKFGAPERCVDVSLEALAWIAGLGAGGDDPGIEQLRLALAEMLQGLNVAWRRAECDALLQR